MVEGTNSWSPQWRHMEVLLFSDSEAELVLARSWSCVSPFTGEARRMRIWARESCLSYAFQLRHKVPSLWIKCHFRFVCARPRYPASFISYRSRIIVWYCLTLFMTIPAFNAYILAFPPHDVWDLILTGSWNANVSHRILLDINFVKMLSRKPKAECLGSRATLIERPPQVNWAWPRYTIYK
jgi:hypothetical protein